MILFLVGFAVGSAFGLVVLYPWTPVIIRAAFLAGQKMGVAESRRALAAMRGELLSIQDRLGFKCGAVKGEG